MTRGSLDKILAATDGSEDATLAVRAAAGLSGRAGAELHIVHVRQAVQLWLGLTSYAYTQGTFEEFAREYEKETEQLMEQQASEAEAEGAEVAGTHLREGREAEEIAGLAGELDAGLVVIGSRGLGAVKRLVMGSTSEGVVRFAPCPVLVTRGGEGIPDLGESEHQESFSTRWSV
jgi:nucleotide-binding universal stress UspA family protein